MKDIYIPKIYSQWIISKFYGKIMLKWFYPPKRIINCKSINMKKLDKEQKDALSEMFKDAFDKAPYPPIHTAALTQGVAFTKMRKDRDNLLWALNGKLRKM